MLRALPPKVAAAAGTLKPAGDQWMVKCPTHEDSTPSLAIKTSDTGNLLLFCHGGCDTQRIVQAWGLTLTDLMVDDNKKPLANYEWTPEGPASDVYHYVDEHGELLYDVLRIPKPGDKKTFRQRRPDNKQKSGWAWNLQGTRRVLYRLPQVLDAIQRGDTIYQVEGEKDVHTLEQLGLTATCNSGGAGPGKYLPEYADIFADGARVIIIADADQPGREHARRIRHHLVDVGANVTVCEPAEGTKDVTEHIQAGLPIGDLLVIEDPGLPDYGLIDIHTLLEEEDEQYDWLIPDLLERGERLMITGPEGSGKSVLLRQIAIMVSAGIDPFVHTDNHETKLFEPQKVLWIDAENSRRQNRRNLLPIFMLTQQLQREIPHGHFTLALRPEGLDLHKNNDSDWLEERIQIVKPALVIIGPWYRLMTADPSDETAARAVISVIDNLRAKHNFTTIMEAHTPHQQPGAAKRPLRPIGSSILLRWPEYGYGLQFQTNPETQLPDYNYCHFIPWRGDRDQRPWPQALTRTNQPGKDPPWMATNPQNPDETRSNDYHQTRNDVRRAYNKGNGGGRNWGIND